MAHTEIQNLCCPTCGALVKQVVSQNGFQAGGTSIGPSEIPCPSCGTMLCTGNSEWSEKHFLKKSFFILGRFVWFIAGSLFVAVPFAVIVGWIAEGGGFVDPIDQRAKILTGLTAYIVGTLVIGTVLCRNAIWEIRESLKRKPC